jgi:Fur family ferric uptake transcriptional regulator
MSAQPATSRAKRRLPPKLADVRARIDAALRERGLHSTGPRRLIIDEFLAAHEHVSLEDMVVRVRGRDSSVGLATVYRTLRMLVECGIAEEHQFGDRMTRYELLSADAHHDHLICTECGKILEFQEPRIERLQDEVALRFGFHQRSHKLEIYGECAACSAAASRPANVTQKRAPRASRDRKSTRKPQKGARRLAPSTSR